MADKLREELDRRLRIVKYT